MRARSILFIIGCALIALPASAASGASRPLVPGPAEGVQATVAGPTLTVRFTGAAAAVGHTLAGKEVEVACDVHPAPGLAFVDEQDLSSSGSATVAADGTQVQVKVARPGDVCELRVAHGDRLRARAVLTPAGATWVDEQVRATQLLDVAIGLRPRTAYPPVAPVVAAGGGRVAALASPDASPPPGQVGYWSDGGVHATYVTLSAAGRRLVLQDLGDGMQRTNILDAEVRWEPLPGNEKLDGSSEQSDSDGPHVREYDGDPVLPAQGVRARVAGGRLVLRFTGRSARAFRAVAGHRVGLICSAVAPSELIGSVAGGPSVSYRVVRVPHHGGTLSLPTPGAHDYCIVFDGSGVVTVVQPTALGRRWSARVGDATAFVTGVPEALASRGATAYPGAATIVAAHPGLTVMATPDAPLKRGAVGVWTDAAQQLVIAARTRSGRRMVAADEGGGMLRSNAFVGLLIDAALAE
jgi:hypothetical protein